MTYAAGHAGPKDSPILHAAIALAPQIKAASDEIEQARRLPSHIVDAVKARASLAWRCRAPGVAPNWIL